MPEVANDALARAQEFFYDAWESGAAIEQIALARRALGISPHCADAYTILAEHAKPGSDKALEFWRRAHEVGRETLGTTGFERYAGDFWGYVETRPYLRARFGLARTLWQRGHTWHAIDHLHGILRLNPNDNQGARYVLAAWLIEVGCDDHLRALLQTFREDVSSTWLWTKVLAEFRWSADTKKSRKLLADAKAVNAYVLAYLVDQSPLHSVLVTQPL